MFSLTENSTVSRSEGTGLRMQESPARHGETKIRHVGADDLRAILRYFDGLSAESRAKFYPRPLDEAQARHIVETADGVDNVHLVAVQAGEIVGYCYFESRGAGRDCHVGLGIADRAQNRGLGHRLVAALSEEARRPGKSGLALCVFKDNPRAIRVYTKAGFTITGETEDGLQHTMRLNLTRDDGAARSTRRPAGPGRSRWRQ
jgi:RimJ/RimL family protein N-acetyltransferase